MKILRVIHTVKADSGGPIEGLKQASRIMSELGTEVVIASLDSPESIRSELEQLPWEVHPLGPGKLGNYSYAPKMREWLNKNVNDFDAVIIHGNWQYHGLATSNACRAHHVPYFIYPHGMLDPWFNDAYPLKKLKKKLYWNWGEHRVLKHAASVMFTCNEEMQLARKSFAPYHVKEKMIGYGTNAPDQEIKELKASAPHPVDYILFLGRIHEKKGLDLLVEAYGLVRSENTNMPELLIAGPVQQADYAARLKTDYPQAGIHWIGSVMGIAKWRLLANAQALILPSHQENFGIVVAEALAVGTPALISDQVNIHSEITEGKAGIVAHDDLAGTIELIKQWNALGPKEKETMAKAAENLFKSQFEIRQATERLIEYIRATLERDE